MGEALSAGVLPSSRAGLHTQDSPHPWHLHCLPLSWVLLSSWYQIGRVYKQMRLSKRTLEGSRRAGFSSPLVGGQDSAGQGSGGFPGAGVLRRAEIARERFLVSWASPKLLEAQRSCR